MSWRQLSRPMAGVRLPGFLVLVLVTLLAVPAMVRLQAAEPLAASDRSKAGPVEFSDAAVSAVLEFHQEITGRTLLRPPSLPASRISLKVEDPLRSAEALVTIEQALQRAGIVVVPLDDCFQIALPSGQTNLLSVLTPPPPCMARGTSAAAMKVVRGLTIKFDEADPGSIIDVWQEITQRTAITSGDLPGAKLTFRSQAELTREQTAWLMESELRLAGIAVLAEGDRLSYILPVERAAGRPRMDPGAVQARAAARYALTTTLRLRNGDAAKLAEAYASITRRREAPLGENAPRVSPGTRFTLITPVGLEQTELIFALEAVAWANGCRFETEGNDQFRLVPAADRQLGPVRRLPSPRTEAMVRADLERKRREVGNDDPAVAELLVELVRVSGFRVAKPEDAESPIREALAIYWKAWPNDAGRLGPAVANAAGALQLRGRLRAADEAISKFLGSLPEEQPDSYGLRKLRAETRARLGRWRGALEDYRRALETDARAVANWTAMAPLFIEAGDLDGYRMHRNFMLARYRSVTNAFDADRVARAALLLPIEGHSLDQAFFLARLAAASSTNMAPNFAERLARIVSRAGTNSTNAAELAPWNPVTSAGIVTNTNTNANANAGTNRARASFADRLAALSARNGTRASYIGGRLGIFLTAGLADYRAGRFSDAADWMERLRRETEGLTPSLLEAQRCFCLALVLHGDAQADAARAALARGIEILQPIVPDTIEAEGDLGPFWEQSLCARILMREARAAIGR